MSTELDKAIEEEKLKVAQVQNQTEIDTAKFNFDKQAQPVQQAQEDRKDLLIEAAFEQATIAKLQNDEALRERVSTTAEKFVDTKMQGIQTSVDTEYKKVFYENRKDACESYGFEEKTTPIWAVKLMSIGYSVMLAIWLLIGTFTYMPVIFIAKKIKVGVKKTWLAILFALALYLIITVGVPFLSILVGR